MIRSCLLCALVLAPQSIRADSLDYYINPVLAKAIKEKQVKPIDTLTSEQIALNLSVLPDVSGAVIVVQTNDRRYAKVVVRSARIKVGDDELEPMILVDRFTTYREATERAIHAQGENTHLYTNFRLDLDWGQVVPERLGGDLLVVAAQDDPFDLSIKPIGEAKLFLLTKPIADVIPKKAPTPDVGGAFQPSYFNGTYQLHDDGRRSGELKLKVTEKGEVEGSFYSDRDGRKYDVMGMTGTPRHAITFSIKFPRTRQQFEGFLFTGDAKAITGFSTLEGRKAGFYAIRKP